MSGVLSINTFVPKDQEAKLALIADAATLMGPSLAPYDTPAPPTASDTRTAAKSAHDKIAPALAKLADDHVLAAINEDLAKLAAASDAVVIAANQALTRFLPTQLGQLRKSLEAQPVTLQTIPPDLARDWLLPDGRARVQVLPKPEAGNTKGLADFVAQVTAVAPDAGGSAVTIEATSATIVGAFRSAAIYAVISIAIILFIALRRLLDMSLVLAPLLLSSLMTVVVIVLGRVAAELRQHHCAAAAAGRRRLLQHLFCDELAGGSDRGAGIGDGAGDPVLGLDDRHRIRLAGAVGTSGDGEHGRAAADQPRLHSGGEPRLHPGAARSGTEAASPPRERGLSGEILMLKTIFPKVRERNLPRATPLLSSPPKSMPVKPIAASPQTLMQSFSGFASFAPIARPSP